MVEDPQKAAVYAWEEGWYDWNISSLTLREIRRYVQRACRLYSVPTMKVRGHKGGMWTTYDPDAESVTFHPHQRNLAVTLHECAHHILFQVCRQEADEDSDGNFEDHGSEFLGVYLFLLNEFGVAPLVALTASAKDAGLRFTPVRGSAPQALRKRVARVLS